MRKTLVTFFTVLVATTLLLPSCRKRDDDEEEALTWAQAQQALDESSLASQAGTLVGSTIEIATDFTIGDAVEAAAAEIRAFIESQLPCASIELTGATLTVEYGVNPGNCTYKGQTYSGTHTITVARNDDGDVLVEHEWIEMENQKLRVNGWANVTWSLAGGSRQVEHELTWERLSDGKTGTGSGNRTQTVLEGGIFEGIAVDGARSWHGDAGTWDLAINDVEMRWVDACPQSGTYSLMTPWNKDLTLTFERKDSDTIVVTVSSGSESFDFDVTTLPS